MGRVIIIHENELWYKPLKAVFEQEGLPHDQLFLDSGSIDLSMVPPEGIYFSKMSASSYTRGHKYSPDYAFVVMEWLRSHGRRIINGPEVLRLELSKMEQYIRLRDAGINVPRTAACFGPENILKTAWNFSPPFILKPNRGGKGIGVQLFQSQNMLAAYLKTPEAAELSSIDNITLVQEYIKSPDSSITRMEFIGGKFVYAVRVDTRGGFELCPAEACRTDKPASAGEVCAVNAKGDLFSIIKDFNSPLIALLEEFLTINKIEVAGVEAVTDASGKVYVYDINTNTNYNPEAEKKAGLSAIKKLCEFLRVELDAINNSKPAEAYRASYQLENIPS